MADIFNILIFRLKLQFFFFTLSKPFAYDVDMTNKMEQNFDSVLKAFAADVTTKFSLSVSFSPEDQLKSPVKAVLEEAGKVLNLDINV